MIQALKLRVPLQPGQRLVILFLCSAILALIGIDTPTASAGERHVDPIRLRLRPTEGVLLEIFSARDGKEDRGWRLDRGASSGLDLVDLVDVGCAPLVHGGLTKGRTGSRNGFLKYRSCGAGVFGREHPAMRTLYWYLLQMVQKLSRHAKG